MNEIQEKFLEALKASLEGQSVSWEEPLKIKQWKELFQLAEMHHVLPLVYEAVAHSRAAEQADSQFMAAFKWKIVQQVSMQALKTESFLCLLECLNQKGLFPITVKGIVCRNLYPKPDYRISGDEDILILQEQYKNYHQAFMDSGLQVVGEETDIEEEFEVTYMAKKGTLYIEAHKALFSPKSDAYGDFNRFFEQSEKRAAEIEIDGRMVRTLGHTDHFFYLICHAFKHFLHSGFGIRQVCDIIMYAEHYGKEIDWQQILKQCQEIHAEYFTVALFKIGNRYLGFDIEKACISRDWQKMKIDESMMLEELLAAGVYGYESRSRMHSSNITLNAVSEQWHGKKGNKVVKTIFLPRESLEKKYQYLKKHKWLLPAAWIQRLFGYYRESKKTPNSDMLESLQIGKVRLDLMRAYKIIE